MGVGDRVAIAMRNYPEWIFTYLGAVSIGAVVVVIGWNLINGERVGGRIS